MNNNKEITIKSILDENYNLNRYSKDVAEYIEVLKRDYKDKFEEEAVKIGSPAIA